ncbi:MAG: hypothetical protein ABGX16_00225 [Pirellulales bacterium]
MANAVTGFPAEQLARGVRKVAIRDKLEGAPNRPVLLMACTAAIGAQLFCNWTSPTCLKWGESRQQIGYTNRCQRGHGQCREAGVVKQVS